VTATGRADTDRSSRVRWWERRTLRFRVIASLLATMIAAFAVISVVTVVSLDHFLTGRIDQQIGDAGGRYVTDYGDATGQAEGTLRAKVVGGRLIDFGIVGSDPAPISSHDRSILTTLPVGSSKSRDLGAVGDYRLHAFHAPDGGTVVVGLPLRALHETVAELLAAELIAFGVVLVVTVAGSRWLISLSLRPLERVTSTARDVAATPLSDTIELPQRVAVADPTTEVGQLADAFNHMLDHVEASLITRRDTEDRLRRFIADASHELRTPVASIRGHAESVRHAPEDVPPVVADSLRRIESEAKRMGVLVDDLLLLARLDAGRPLDRVPVDLTRVAIDAANDARVAGPDHRWVLDLPEAPITVMGDEDRLLELVTNLLTNAKVHTPSGSCVELKLSYDATTGAVLSVTDDGPGIPVAAQPKVFERFFRSDPGRARMTGSSGLGLAIVAAVALAHGGSVSLESRPGHTRFAVLLPATSEAIQSDDSA
jgi:two-component system OmpR family sensor kinase